MNEPKIKNESLYDQASWFSRVFFTWTLPLYRKGRVKELSEDDLCKPPKGDKIEDWAGLLERRWNENQAKSRRSFAWVLVTTFYRYYLPYNLLDIFLNCILENGYPLALGIFTRYFVANSDVTKSMATAAAIYMASSSLLRSICGSNLYWAEGRLRQNLVGTVKLVVYRKLLRLSRNSIENTGKLINSFHKDCSVVIGFFSTPIQFITIPVNALYAVYIMYIYVGHAVWAGLAVMLLYVPYELAHNRLMKKYRETTRELEDKRVKLLREIIDSIRLIKLYAWEKPFANLMSNYRNEEVKGNRDHVFYSTLHNIFSWNVANFMICATYIVYILNGNRLDAETLFVTLNLFYQLGYPVSELLPWAFSRMQENKLSARRVQEILELPEQEARGETNENQKVGSMIFSAYSAKWNRDQERNALTDINLAIEQGQLAMVIGQVGAGKTCLLNAMLSEIETVEGHLDINGRLSYAPQESWCFSGTVRENILLGVPDVDEARYQEVINVCGLKRDLKIFPDGDATVVGEKGYMLSGGQKARVTLARAVYHQADIYLLDDPLSAVDPAVANHIFRECIQGFLKDKTVVLVTHQVQFLPAADQVIYMKDATAQTGPCRDFEHLDFLKNFISKADDSNSVLLNRTISSVSNHDEELMIQKNKKEKIKPTTSAFVLLWKFLRIGVTPMVLMSVMFLVVMDPIITQTKDHWLAKWSEKNQTEDVEQEQADQIKHLWFYCDLVLLSMAFLFARTLCFYFIGVKCSGKLHDLAFEVTLKAPMKFFETTGTGDIMSTFTKDVRELELLLYSLRYFCEKFIEFSIKLLYVTTISPLMLTLAIILGSLMWPIEQYFAATKRSLRKLDKKFRAPTYQHVINTVDGLITIRALNCQERFTDAYQNVMQDYAAVDFIYDAGRRTLTNMMDILCNLYRSAVYFVLLYFTAGVTAATAGLALRAMFTLQYTFRFFFFKFQSFEEETHVIDRVFEYLRLEPEEADDQISHDCRQFELDQGDIHFKGLSLRYDAEGKQVLNQISCDIKEGEKIGICGRTGAGKSSLIACLFRLVNFDGVIQIGGKDTKNVRLAELRRALSIIPQDPVLFSGSIRSNLDPFKEYTDEQLWQALTDVKMSEVVDRLPDKLDNAVTEKGGNLSAGEKQLMCLARALLRKNRVLVLDEATANVDHETDQLIQATIRSKFAHCTVLTIAHRINTIIDLDRIMVISDGQLAECDRPQALLEKRGLFYSMARKAGLI